ncbi:MAG: putative aminopeptidase [Chthonomonadales bacterium]|nr:putative aminopeptidase [Chthonomonadales bacterium]
MYLKANNSRWSASQGLGRSTGRFGRTALTLFCLGLSATFGFGGCQSAPPPAAVTPVATTSSGPANSAGTSAATPAKIMTPEPFDGERAYDILKKQCDFGVRPLGTEAHEKTKDYLIAEMQKYADSTMTQKFTYHGLPVTNVIGIFNPAGSDKPSAHPILLMAHWDTRPIADGPYSDKRDLGYKYGPTGWNRTAPIMGANDAGSGVAVLLEMARLFKAHKPAVGVVILLDDGEDYGDFLADGGKGDGIELGSRYFAKHFKETPAFGTPFYGILLDMVGGKGAVFPREQQSYNAAPDICEKIYGTAKELKYEHVFQWDRDQDINDDHIALIAEHIKMVDLIHPLPHGGNDLNDVDAYRYWHTQQDTADKCSAKTLKIVGEVVTEVLYRETAVPVSK